MTDTGSEAISLIGALLLLLVPGGALAHVLGFRGLWWLATSPAFSIAAIASTGVVAAPLSVRFAWWEPTIVLGVACAMIVGVRAIRGRELVSTTLGRWSRRDALLIAVVLISAIAAAIAAGSGVGSWDHVSQTYDGVFHLNAIAWIESTGDASSFDLYRITHPGSGNQFYPAAWHALVASTAQMTGAPIPVATNATWFAAQSLIWVPGVTLLGTVIASPRWRYVAGGVTAIASLGLIGFPDLLLAWGTLYPTALAYALLPLGLVLTLRVMGWVRRRANDNPSPAPTAAITGLVMWLIASSLAHPRSLFSFAVIAMPAIVYEVARAVHGLWRKPRWRRRLLVSAVALLVGVVGIGSAATLYVYRSYDLVNRPISAHLNGGPATATQSMGESFLQAMTLTPVDPTLSTPLTGSFLLAALVVLGLAAAAMIPRTRWIVAGFLLVVMLYVLAAGSNSDLAKVLTGLWYKDKFRLFAILPVLQAPLIALGVTSLLSWRLIRKRAVAGTLAVITVATAIATSNVVLDAPSMIHRVFALPAHGKQSRLLDADEQRLLEQLPRYVPASDIVAGDPWDGSTLSWAIGNRRALFPHLAGVWSPDELLIAGHLDEIQSDRSVCAAAQRLDLHWVVEDPELLWGQPVEAAPFIGFHRAVNENVLTPVLRIGSAGLYRIPSCRS